MRVIFHENESYMLIVLYLFMNNVSFVFLFIVYITFISFLLFILLVFLVFILLYC
jgi:hypothetical protein